MAAAELRRSQPRWTTSALVVFGLLLATTLATAGVVATIPALKVHARESLQALGLDLRPQEPSVHALLVTRVSTNLVIALTPVEWALLGAGRSARWRPAVDALLAATFATNAALVGAALGSYGLQLVPYLPHLPIEWGALACGVTPWLLARRRPLDRRALLVPLAATVGLLVAAAGVETWLTPQS